MVWHSFCCQMRWQRDVFAACLAFCRIDIAFLRLGFCKSFTKSAGFSAPQIKRRRIQSCEPLSVIRILILMYTMLAQSILLRFLDGIFCFLGRLHKGDCSCGGRKAFSGEPYSGFLFGSSEGLIASWHTFSVLGAILVITRIRVVRSRTSQCHAVCHLT